MLVRRVLILTLISFQALGASPACEVYGITDSPQAVSCKFKDSTVEISCRNGLYFLNEEPVEAAFHMDVEEGPVPLIFKAKSSELTLNLKEGRIHEGVLSRGKKKFIGKCILTQPS